MPNDFTRHGLARATARDYLIDWLLSEDEHAEAFTETDLSQRERTLALAHLREIAAELIQKGPSARR